MKQDYLADSLVERTKALIDFQADKIAIHTSEVLTGRKALADLNSKKKLSADDEKKKEEREVDIKAALEHLKMAQLRAETLSELLEKYEKRETVKL